MTSNDLPAARTQLDVLARRPSENAYLAGDEYSGAVIASEYSDGRLR
ncbi:MAG: hypothetical protein JO107_05500 [Hyphomicrobiales bacterium]|nr:hypothetical protein [Hyphomicrobiales bacterium]